MFYGKGSKIEDESIAFIKQ